MIVPWLSEMTHGSPDLLLWAKERSANNLGKYFDNTYLFFVPNVVTMIYLVPGKTRAILFNCLPNKRNRDTK